MKDSKEIFFLVLSFHLGKKLFPCFAGGATRFRKFKSLIKSKTQKKFHEEMRLETEEKVVLNFLEVRTFFQNAIHSPC